MKLSIRPLDARRLPIVAAALLTSALLTSAAATASDSAASGLEIAQRYREAHAPRIVRDYAGLLGIPNASGDRDGIRQNAETLAAALADLGVTSQLLELEGANPIVFGALDVPGATRTLGIYVHYDGQPADATQWTQPPWQPTLTTRSLEQGGEPRALPADGEAIDPEWRLYARSASDDKAPLGALLPVLRALREAGVAPTSNLRFFFEGEEEAGSPHLEAFLTRHRELFAPIDLWLFFDGPVHASGRPQLAFGVRGVTGMSLTVYGATRSLHSGHYGGWAPVPGQLLAELLASMKDASGGRVLIEGFYDSVTPLGDGERRALAALPDHEAALRRELGLAMPEGGGARLEERVLLPSLTVRGLASGNVGELAQNVIPATARAELGLRLVAGNDPQAMLDLVEAHIRAQGFHIVREEPELETRLRYPRIVRVERHGGYPAARTAMDEPVLQEVIAATREAARQALDAELVLVPGLGGSLPLHLFTGLLDKPTVIVPIANHDNNQHAPDENLRLANLWYGIDLYGALLTMP